MERTNVTDKGYTYNGQNYVNQTKVDSQGNNYTVAIPSAISASNLSQPQATIPVTQPVYNTATQQSQTAQMGAYPVNASQTADQNLAMQAEAEKNALQASQTDYSKLLTQSGGKGTDLATQYNQQDTTGQSVNSLAGKLRALSAQSQALGLDTLAKQQAEINKATGQNITQSAVSRNTADATRENLINTARIAMESAIVNADYQTAKSYADQMVDAKYDQLEADTKAVLFNLENNKDKFNAAEKKVAEATTARINKEKQVMEEKKANEKQVSDLLINASQQGVPASVEAKAKAIQARGGSAQEVASALGAYSGDYLSTQIKKAQLQKLNLDNSEAYNKLYSAPVGGLKQLSYEENAKFNSTPEVKGLKDASGYAQAVADYKSAINKYGTGEMFGAGKGVLGQAYSALVGATKDYYTLGTLDSGVQKLIALGIPEPGVLGIKSSRVGALDEALRSANAKIKTNTDQLLKTNYKNTEELKQLLDGTNNALLSQIGNEELLNSIPSSTTSTNTTSTANFFNK